MQPRAPAKTFSAANRGMSRWRQRRGYAGLWRRRHQRAVQLASQGLQLVLGSASTAQCTPGRFCRFSARRRQASGAFSARNVEQHFRQRTVAICPVRPAAASQSCFGVSLSHLSSARFGTGHALRSNVHETTLLIVRNFIARSGWEIPAMKPSFASARSLTERPKRILLAEDDDAFRLLLADVLRADGHDVIEVCDGQHLLDKIAGALSDGNALEGIELILSDIRMPHFNALEVIAAMRSARIDVPIVLMTAFGDERTHDQAQLLGVFGVLDKPFEFDDLRTVVCNVLFGHINGVTVPENDSRHRSEP